MSLKEPLQYYSKEELLTALADEILDQVATMYCIPYTKSQSIEEQLKKVIETKIEPTLSESFLQINKIILGELLKDEGQLMTRCFV